MKNKLMKIQFLLLLTTVVVVQSFARSNSVKIKKEHPRLIGFAKKKNAEEKK